MSTINGLNPKPINGFNGLYSRGSVDTCPEDHLTDCFNCIFPGKSQIDLREPLTQQLNSIHGSIVSFATVNLGGPNPVAVLLTLMDTGELFDETRNLSILALITGTGGVHPDDFQALSMFGRVYITFMYKGKALPGYQVYVYYYSTTRSNFIMEPAAGNVAPTATPTFTGTNPVIPGCDAGQHKISYSFQNDRGFLSPMCVVPCFATVVGGTTIEISVSIPSVPINCTQIVFFMTPADQLEMFFLPEGVVHVTTPGGPGIFTLSITSPDTSLIKSADYLNNILVNIPTCSKLMFYHGRMVAIGQWQFPDDILVSDEGSPEQFNLVNNVVHMPVDYGSNTSNGGMVIRDTLYVTKPNGTYAIQDTSNFASTWPVTIVDSGIGAWYRGISVFDSSMSGQDISDMCFVASERGLMIFNGGYEEIPLTFKVENVWRSINTIDPAYFYKVNVAHDVWKKRIYIALPLVSNTLTPTFQAQDKNGLILMGDYQEGLNPQSIKWSIWNTGLINDITKIIVENFTLTFNNDMIYQLCLCGGPDRTKIYKVIPFPNIPDQGTTVQTIDQIITTGPIPYQRQDISTFLMLDFSIYGSGSTSILWYGKNRAVQGPGSTINLTAYNNSFSSAPGGVSSGNPCNVSIIGHKLLENQMVTITGATGVWAVINGAWNVHVVNADNFTIGINSAGFPGLTGSVVVSHTSNKMDIQRLINFTSECIFVRVRCDQLIPGGIQGRFFLDQIEVHFRKMWTMRPALLQSN